MSAVEYANLALAVVNALLALLIGAVYLRNHREMRSPFTLGLLLFAAFLVIHNVLVAYHIVTMMGQFYGNEVYLLLESALQTVALGALAMATFR